MDKQWLWITLTLIICFGFSAVVYAAGDDQVKYKAHLGITPKDGPSGGVVAAGDVIFSETRDVVSKEVIKCGDRKGRSFKLEF